MCINNYVNKKAREKFNNNVRANIRDVRVYIFNFIKLQKLSSVSKLHDLYSGSSFSDKLN